MESGKIVEFIDRQKILCAVVLEVKKQRLRLLTENNREVNLSANRLSHASDLRLELSSGRTRMVASLKEIAERRKALIDKVDIKELWEVLNTEQEWIDLDTMTEFCFSGERNCDHESAVIRAFFENRLYFKFDHHRFFPHSEAQLERLIAQEKESARRTKIIEDGGRWFRSIAEGTLSPSIETLTDDEKEYVSILKSYFLYDKESSCSGLGKAMAARAGLATPDQMFQVLVAVGIFDQDENLDILRFDIPVHFSTTAMAQAESLVGNAASSLLGNGRKDLTELPLMTIDGQSTLDYDDAISIENFGDHYRLGVHIIDVGHYIRKGEPIDQSALTRGSSIYMPDRKIPMLPPALAEGLCSLKAGEQRPAISIMINLTPQAEVIDYDIIASLIKVHHQLTYFDVNMMIDDNPDIVSLRDLATKFRQFRLDQGAVQISLPDINVWLDEDGAVNVSRVNRESPGRMLVAEIMILANWLMARFLATHQVPAIFRSQPDPKDRLFKGDEGTLFQNCMQRRLLSRFILDNKPERHSGLGLDNYVTATSPIRKYFDLVTQRQLRAVLGLETPYTREEINRTIQVLEQPMSYVSTIQRSRHRYWLLKYLEKQIGQREEAIVLAKRRNSYQILLGGYMLECDLPMSSGIDLSPEDLIQVRIQHVNARKDVISVYMG